jgi:hypothetical protein
MQQVTDLQAGSVLGFTVVGILTLAGAFAASWLVAGVVHGVLAVGRCVARLRRHAGQARGRLGTVRTGPDSRLERAPAGTGAGADHALLARQAWWRLRC